MKFLLDIHGYQRLNSDIFWFLPEFPSSNNRRSKVRLMKYFNMFSIQGPQRNLCKLIGYTAMNFSAEIHGYQRMKADIQHKTKVYICPVKYFDMHLMYWLQI